jgi:hypothetical protein
LAYSPNHLNNPLVGKKGGFSPLQDKGFEPQEIPDAAAVKDLLKGQAVPFDLGIASTDSAVIAIILAIIGQFNETPEIDFIAVMFESNLPGCSKEGFRFLGIIGGNKMKQILIPGNINSKHGTLLYFELEKEISSNHA